MSDVSEMYAMRKFKQLSQVAFARRLGYSRSTINDFENGYRNPSISIKLAFIREFGDERTEEFYKFFEHLKKIDYKYPQ